MDLLEQAIAAAKELMKARYVLHIQRGTENKTIYLKFYKRAFYHLFGFHKIKEIDTLFAKKRKSIAFRAISSNNKLLEAITRSSSFKQIESRLVCLCLFEKVMGMENVELFKKLGTIGTIPTLIAFDYLLSVTYGNNRLFYFFVKENESECAPISLFIDNRLSYEIKHQRWDVIRIRKESAPNFFRGEGGLQTSLGDFSHMPKLP